MLLGHFFYFCGLIIFLVNIHFIYEIFDYIRIKEWFFSFKKVTNKIPTDKDFKRGDLEKYKNLNGVVSTNLLWLFFGILSGNWKIFLLILSISLIVDGFVYLIGQFKLISKLIFLLKTILISASILILTINHFHLHMDLYQLLSGLLT
jgi:hypothetical protein